MNYLDLFSGIGGFALGAHWAGMKFENHYFSEIEKWPVELYQKRFPDAVPLGDITKIDTSKLPEGEWIITGGFPCQDISCAGKGKGLIDNEGNTTRSGLWFTYAELISKLRPKFAIMENVGALTIRGLDAVLGSLAEIGYDAEWQDIRAEDMGAPHKRERIWIIAYPGLQRPPEHEKQAMGVEQRSKSGSNEMADTSGQGLPGDVCPELGNIREKERTLKGRKPSGGNATEGGAWTIEPAICELVDGLPAGMDRYEGRLTTKSYKRTDQLKGSGNAILPQIAELLFRQIKPLP